jgi:hypothetical protein
MEKQRDLLRKAMDSPTMWFSFDEGVLISDQELRKRIGDKSVEPSDVSSRPDLFPVFGNMQNAVDVLLYGGRGKEKESGGEQEGEGSEEQEGEGSEEQEGESSKERDRYECHDKVKGFRNTSGTSCFLDSVLRSMFHLKNSPFYDGLFKDKQFSYDKVCSDDPKKNEDRKREVQSLMQADIENVMERGKTDACTKLRSLLGRICRQKGEQDMSKNMHDAVELYMRVMNVLEYNPIVYTSRKSRSDAEEGPFIPDENVTKYRAPRLGIAVRDSDRIRWPDSWVTTIENLEPITPFDRFIKEEISIVSADVMVVSIDRARFAPGGGWSSVQLSNKRIAVDRTLRVGVEKGSVEGGSEEEQETERREGNGTKERTYELMSAVYLPYAGHYQAILKCNGVWRVYNDVNVVKSYMINQIDDEKADEIIETKAVLLFYY